MKLYSKILASGSYLPAKILSNKDLEKMVDTSDEWIVSRSGIKERRIVADNETSADMAYNATVDVIKSSNIAPSKIDLILVATSTPDILFPSTACLIQRRLGLNNIPAFDLQAACTGFLYALATADAFIRSNSYKTILVIGVDTVSRFIDYTDRNTCVLFGDGAGAVIVQASDEPGIICNEIHADGSGEEVLHVKGHIYNGELKGHPYMAMDGKAVYKMAVRNLAEVATSVLTKSGYSNEQVDWFVPHQANLRIIESTAAHLNISMEKVIVTVDIHGNTSAASVPLALDHAIKNGKIKRGDLLLLEGVGAGFTWGASLIRY
ncbi:MAG: 3-oxoacyl-ACP synthase [Burkholderiales bacterium]|jgi:3-oxoacyl-[acyl-carrier-protein] synthase-3|nr:3-oxoacyl-ACP synthase [Burkholderiales bacterium]